MVMDSLLHVPAHVLRGEIPSTPDIHATIRSGPDRTGDSAYAYVTRTMDAEGQDIEKDGRSIRCSRRSRSCPSTRRPGQVFELEERKVYASGGDGRSCAVCTGALHQGACTVHFHEHSTYDRCRKTRLHPERTWRICKVPYTSSSPVEQKRPTASSTARSSASTQSQRYPHPSFSPPLADEWVVDLRRLARRPIRLPRLRRPPRRTKRLRRHAPLG